MATTLGSGDAINFGPNTVATYVGTYVWTDHGMELGRRTITFHSTNDYTAEAWDTNEVVATFGNYAGCWFQN